MSKSRRYYHNSASDYTPAREIHIAVDDFRSSLRNAVKDISHNIYKDDFSLYTGCGGQACAVWFSHLFKAHEHHDYANDLIRKMLQQPPTTHKGRVEPTFHTGHGGVLALGIAVAHNDANYQSQLIADLVALKSICHDPTFTSYEMLYGRAGYVYACVFAHHFSKDARLLQAAAEIADVIVAQCGACGVLRQTWHGKEYLGGAHGTSGIVQTLLLLASAASTRRYDTVIQSTIEWLLTLQYQTGNFPSSLESAEKRRDELVQWCHGAPAFVPMLCSAYRYFGERKYLDAAERAADTIWQRGLLAKGPGLCHGAPGNAFSFLSLFRTTRSEKHLHRAHCFAQWVVKYDTSSVSDTPFSLFEGIGGACCLWAAMLNPQASWFPGYELPPS